MKGHLFEGTKDEVTRLVLVRHGRTEANETGRLGSREEFSLDEIGREQARRVATRVKDFDPTALYVSPQLRARQTAEQVALATGLDQILCSELMEYHFGKVSNMLVSEIETVYPELYRHIMKWLALPLGKVMPRPVFPEAESIEEFVGRAIRFIDLVVQKHPGECVVAITHMGLIKAVLTHVSGGDMRIHQSTFLADNASISVIDFYLGYPVIRSFNEICHLENPLKFGRKVIL
jgi:broad specificity phosphatase PhoE